MHSRLLYISMPDLFVFQAMTLTPLAQEAHVGARWEECCRATNLSLSQDVWTALQLSYGLLIFPD